MKESRPVPGVRRSDAAVDILGISVRRTDAQSTLQTQIAA